MAKRAMNPRGAVVLLNVSRVLLDAGHQREALSAIADAERAGMAVGGLAYVEAAAYAGLGDSVAARAAIARGLAANGDQLDDKLAMAYIAIGDRDRALSALEGSIESNLWGLGYAGRYMTNSLWADFRTDPRFVRAMQKLKALER